MSKQKNRSKQKKGREQKWRRGGRVRRCSGATIMDGNALGVTYPATSSDAKYGSALLSGCGYADVTTRFPPASRRRIKFEMFLAYAEPFGVSRPGISLPIDHISTDAWLISRCTIDVTSRCHHCRK